MKHAEDEETQWLVTLCPDDGYPRRVIWLVWALTESQANERALAKSTGSARVIQNVCVSDLPDDEYIATYEAPRNAR